MEQRKTARFELHLPLRIMRTETGLVSTDALTRNISSAGVMFTSDVDLPIGGTIEFVVTLSAERGRELDLRCVGKVVRLEKSRSELQDSSYLIAVTLDRYQFVRRESKSAGSGSASQGAARFSP